MRSPSSFSVSRASHGVMLATATLLLFGLPSQAQLVEIDDLSLPASPDGFNLTQDLTTGLEWLDVTVTEGRTFDDLVGNDGTNEFEPGGDFEGFRHATALELTGWTPSGQLDSLFSNFGFTSTFSSIGGYPLVRGFLSYVGCVGSCGTWGFIQGAYVEDLVEPLAPRWAKAEALFSQGNNFGRLDAGTSLPLVSFPTNGSVTIYGHFLVRPLPEPATTTALGAGIAALAFLARRRRAHQTPR